MAFLVIAQGIFTPSHLAEKKPACRERYPMQIARFMGLAGLRGDGAMRLDGPIHQPLAFGFASLVVREARECERQPGPPAKIDGVVASGGGEFNEQRSGVPRDSRGNAVASGLDQDCGQHVAHFTEAERAIKSPGDASASWSATLTASLRTSVAAAVFPAFRLCG
jgi:hypothetical protein